MTEFFKAIRPDGTSFNDPAFHWSTEPGGVTRHPLHPRSTGRRHWTDASYYLSVSTEVADCTGVHWPARLLIVEPLEGVDVWTPHPDYLPHKRASLAWRTAREADPVALLGPNGAQVVAFLGLLPGLSTAAWAFARRSGRAAARDAARYDAWCAAWDSTRISARISARDAARAAVRDAARDAALALVVRDLIIPDAFATLTEPMRAAGVDFDNLEEHNHE